MVQVGGGDSPALQPPPTTIDSGYFRVAVRGYFTIILLSTRSLFSLSIFFFFFLYILSIILSEYNLPKPKQK